MEDGFRFSVPTPPEGRPLTAAEAEQLLRARIAALPEGSKEHANALWQLMRLMSITGRHAEGLAILDALIASAVDTEARAEIALATGQLMEGVGDFASAAGAYARGIGLESVGPMTRYFLHNNLGYSLNQLGQHAEAERVCRAAIAIDPQRFNAHKNLGVACEARGSYAEAARAFLRAAHCEASDPRALGHLEALVDAHPEVASEIPDIHAQVERCAAAVETAIRVRAEAAARGLR